MEAEKISRSGVTLVELIVTIIVMGALTFAVIPLLSDLFASLWISQGSSGANYVIREAASRMEREIRMATVSPDSLRPRVSADGGTLRLYLSEDPADSIRYFFSGGEGSTFLYRLAGSSGAVMVPSSASDMTAYLKGSFRVSGGYGYTPDGAVEINLNAGQLQGMETDSTSVEFTVFCRNFLRAE